MLIRITLFTVIYCYVNAVEDTGTPAGFMADCPGMNRSTTISKETQKTLSALIMWPSSGIFSTSSKRCSLNARGAACVARAVNLKKRRTQVLISGYLDMQSTLSPLTQYLATPYLNMGRNVLILEVFPVLFRTYPTAARVTRPLGILFGEFLAELTKLGLSPKKLELVGGSLGAHIASYAATRYKQLTGQRPARLTGLDPAGPCFRHLPPSERFNADAAIRVDALHTNIDGFGIADNIAQVDFYANGGEFQPSMSGDFILPCFLLCSHVRAAFYWMESFQNPDKFLAVNCNDVAEARHGDCYNKPMKPNLLGPNTNFSRPGVYYLPTTDRHPYYLGSEGLKKRKFGVNTYLLKSTPDDDIDV